MIERGRPAGLNRARGGKSLLATPARPDASAASIEIKRMTPGQRWRLRRNLVIYLAAGRGASQRLLGDVFDLPHSRISAIVQEMKSKYDND